MREHFRRWFSTRVHRPPLSPRNGDVTVEPALDHENAAAYMLAGQGSDGSGGHAKTAGTVSRDGLRCSRRRTVGSAQRGGACGAPVLASCEVIDCLQEPAAQCRMRR